MAKKKKQRSIATGGIQEKRKMRTFAQKVKAARHVVICPVCGEEKKCIRYVRPEKGKIFKDTKVHVCGCNREEIYGVE